MSGPIVDATVAHSKRLLESISFSVRTNIFRRGKWDNAQNKYKNFFYRLFCFLN